MMGNKVVDTQELATRTLEAVREWIVMDRSIEPDEWPVTAIDRLLRALRTTQCSGDTQELADPQVVVAGKLLTIKPGAPEIALLCRAIFRASFADDEDEALVNQKYQEWEEGQAKAIRAARFVLRALGGNGSVVRALRTTHSPSKTVELLREIKSKIAYRVENPSAWDTFDQGVSDLLGGIVKSIDSHLGEMKGPHHDR